jgi:hypothetical protein
MKIPRPTNTELAILRTLRQKGAGTVPRIVHCPLIIFQGFEIISDGTRKEFAPC